MLGRLITLNEGLLVWYRVMMASVFFLLYLVVKKGRICLPIKDILRIAWVGLLLCIHWLLFYGSIVVGLIIDLITQFTGIPTIIGLFVGIGFYFLVFIFQIINIKVEKKANNQAIEILQSANIFNEQEIETFRKLLKLYILSDVIVLVLSILKLILQILKIFARSSKKA